MMIGVFPECQQIVDKLFLIYLQFGLSNIDASLCLTPSGGGAASPPAFRRL
jgi:hypothetical protein